MDAVTDPGQGWYPVALAEDLEPSTSTGTRLFGRELVVWRDGAGNSHVWEDRCPHRGMRLSFGFVRGTHIACLYHGWRFDGAGQCRLIPAHPKLEVPATIQANRYASGEWRGLVWVFDGPTEAASEMPHDIGVMTPVRSLTMDASAEDVRAALDAAPSPFAVVESLRVHHIEALTLLATSSETLVVGFQPLSSSETCLHLAIAGPRAAHGSDGRARVSRWAEALRRDAEDRARLGKLHFAESMP